MADSPLGDYLRGRRAAVRPADVDLPAHGPRRVPGLRREEVAVLAGVSADYYVRLEQGRERSPSPQVLGALADALALDGDGRQHLFRLAGLAPRPPAPAPERADPALRQLLDAWPGTPALLLGRTYDVLAANRLGSALFSGFPRSGNLVEEVFLDPAARTFYVDWPAAAASTVAGLRLLEGTPGGDPRARELVHRLSRQSAEFAELWDRNEARGKSAEVKRFAHPHVGPLTLGVQTFDVRSAPGQQLVVYHAEPGSVSAQSLALLGSLAVTP
ncbi:helix-turn-helix transcriptional regulator [Paenibacillus sp. TRM 82003]|uniref:helix-turn-helix domain-containing protein n=1 Tax=Kineococcus sp. TRM81007 TaxID=2925831 RepID=UPI001F598001|nr:helix-turn-helix transcriptional regulator [Kineococcus sp. TRM81007]MCI2240497.1 helix-turn-helix transcriptional regulator [Kineococcus sp. TRM81007]MCI3925230.1 helix-turn-helix transcriptional regulator [Paenibacillus sp. TRM 82003]